MKSWLKVLYRHVFVGMGASSIGFLSLFAGINWRVTTYDQGFALGVGASIGLLTVLFHTKIPDAIVWLLIWVITVGLYVDVSSVYRLHLLDTWQMAAVNIGALTFIWLGLFLLNRWAFDKDVTEVNQLLKQRRNHLEGEK